MTMDAIRESVAPASTATLREEPRQARTSSSQSGFKIGVLGGGSFAKHFIPLFQTHPLIRSVGLAEVLPERRRTMADRFEIQDTYESLDQLCDSDCDAIAIFTQRWLHAPQAIQAMNAGKDVYCAVPAGVTLDELRELVETVEQTGRIFMLGETSRYHPSNLFCRQKFQENAFGRFVYAEAEYLHDMAHGFTAAYQYSGGESWKETASFPPMYYPTHSVGNIVSAVGSRMVHVSCLGVRDEGEDGIFDPSISLWNNSFSNQTALFQMANGGIARANEFRRVGFRCAPGKECVRLKVFGTKATFEQNAVMDNWICSADDGRHENFGMRLDDVTSMLDARHGKAEHVRLEGGEQEDFFAALSAVHPRERLPPCYATMHNGHSGSHQFLVDDFARAVVTRKVPYTHVWFGAHLSAAGITAHESSLQEGRRLPIPDLGEKPADIPLLDYTEIHYK